MGEGDPTDMEGKRHRPLTKPGVNGETKSPVNKYPITDGRPNLRAAKPMVAAAVNTTPTFNTSGAVSTIDAISQV